MSFSQTKVQGAYYKVPSVVVGVGVAGQCITSHTQWSTKQKRFMLQLKLLDQIF